MIAEGKGFLGTYFTNVLIKINEKLSDPLKIILLDNLITSKDKKKYLDSDVEFLEQVRKSHIILSRYRSAH